MLWSINILDATRHLSGVHTYSPHMPLKWRVVKAVIILCAARSQGCDNTMCHLSALRKKPQKSNLHLRLLLLWMAYTAE